MMEGSSSKRILSPPLQRGILLLGFVLYVWLQVVGAWHPRHNNDFRHIYLGTRALLDGDNPYSHAELFAEARSAGLYEIDAAAEPPRPTSLNPYVYLPFTGLSLAFLAPLTFLQASNLWFVLNHVFAVASVFLIAGTMSVVYRTAAAGGLLLALAVSDPLTRTLTAGQLNLVLLVCTAGAYYLLEGGRHGAAGAILGYAAVFKLSPGAFGLWFLLRGRWRSLAVMMSTAAGLLILSVVVFGWEVHREFVPVLAQMSYGRSTWQEYNATFWKDPENQSLNSLFTHLLVADNRVTRPWVNGTQRLANAMTWVVTLGLLGCYVWCTWKRGGAGAVEGEGHGGFSGGDRATFHATVVLSLLVPSLLWDHYLVALILPVAWLAEYYGLRRKWGMLAAVLALYMLTAGRWPFTLPVFRQGWGVPLMSMKLFPTLAIFALTLAAARREEIAKDYVKETAA